MSLRSAILTRITLVIVCAAYLRDGGEWPVAVIAVLQTLGLCTDLMRADLDGRAAR